MQKTLRSLAVVLFLVASFAVAKTPSTPSKDIKVVMHEGSSPMPDCYPGQVCR
jgi:hypothetical protein